MATIRDGSAGFVEVSGRVGRAEIRLCFYKWRQNVSGVMGHCDMDLDYETVSVGQTTGPASCSMDSAVASKLRDCHFDAAQ